jgi:phosphohistidine swiveling domain-containing protein
MFEGPEPFPEESEDSKRLRNHLYRLYVLVLGASISFSPAVLLVVNSEKGLDSWLLGLWIFVLSVLLHEWWLNARFNWKHELDFRPQFLKILYAFINTAYVGLLILLPLSVAVASGYLKLVPFGEPAGMIAPRLQFMTVVFLLLCVADAIGLAMHLCNDFYRRRRQKARVAASLVFEFIFSAFYLLLLKGILLQKEDEMVTGIAIMGIYYARVIVYYGSRWSFAHYLITKSLARTQYLFRKFFRNMKIDIENPHELKREPILRGIPASGGRAIGQVRILKENEEPTDFPTGAVLVATVTSPAMLPYIFESCAIVTDVGGLTSHAAIVSRELGIPCVVNTGTATVTLKNGVRVEVDGTNGLVFLVNDG